MGCTLLTLLPPSFTHTDHTGSGYFNYVVLHSFYCDLQGEKPRVVYEYPENTVKGETTTPPTPIHPAHPTHLLVTLT